MIKISNITNLQDARYCAAMGFQLINFSLLSEDTQRLSAQQIREIAAWLSGPQYVLACNEASVADLQAIHGTFPYHYIEIPAEDWQKFSFLPAIPFILKVKGKWEVAALATLIEEVKKHHNASKIEIEMDTTHDFSSYESLFPNIFIHTPSLQILSELVETYQNMPFGFSIREEGGELSGDLDYEALDKMCEQIEHKNAVMH